MAPETPYSKKTTANEAPGKEPFGDAWSTMLDMQRQWLGLWTLPLGAAPKPEEMWSRWHKIGTECLDLNARTAELTHHFVNDQVKIGRSFTDKAFQMTREHDEREPKETAPEFAREWCDTAQRGAKRALAFGNESRKAFEEFGLNVSETMTQAPVEAK